MIIRPKYDDATVPEIVREYIKALEEESIQSAWFIQHYKKTLINLSVVMSEQSKNVVDVLRVRNKNYRESL